MLVTGAEPVGAAVRAFEGRVAETLVGSGGPGPVSQVLPECPIPDVAVAH